MAGSTTAHNSHMFRNILVIIVLGFQFGCAASDEVRIDTSSAEAFEDSLSAMHRTLTSSEQLQLMMALLQIRMIGIGSATEAQASIGDDQVLAAHQMSKADGLTFEEILSLAEQSDTEVEVLK